MKCAICGKSSQYNPDGVCDDCFDSWQEKLQREDDYNELWGYRSEGRLIL